MFITWKYLFGISLYFSPMIKGLLTVSISYVHVVWKATWSKYPDHRRGIISVTSWRHWLLKPNTSVRLSSIACPTLQLASNWSSTFWKTLAAPSEKHWWCGWTKTYIQQQCYVGNVMLAQRSSGAMESHSTFCDSSHRLFQPSAKWNYMYIILACWRLVAKELQVMLRQQHCS